VPDYTLRNIEPAIWQAFKQRAAVEGRSLRWVLIELIRRYVADGL
jgi:hypothetical protein